MYVTSEINRFITWLWPWLNKQQNWVDSSRKREAELYMTYQAFGFALAMLGFCNILSIYTNIKY